MRLYARHNLSFSARRHADTVFRLMAHMAETGVFLNLGLTALSLRKGYHVGFIAWAIIACLVARAIHVYLASEFAQGT